MGRWRVRNFLNNSTSPASPSPPTPNSPCSNSPTKMKQSYSQMHKNAQLLIVASCVNAFPGLDNHVMDIWYVFLPKLRNSDKDDPLPVQSSQSQTHSTACVTRVTKESHSLKHVTACVHDVIIIGPKCHKPDLIDSCMQRKNLVLAWYRNW